MRPHVHVRVFSSNRFQSEYAWDKTFKIIAFVERKRAPPLCFRRKLGFTAVVHLLIILKYWQNTSPFHETFMKMRPHVSVFQVTGCQREGLIVTCPDIGRYKLESRRFSYDAINHNYWTRMFSM